MNIDINVLVEEYKSKTSELINDNIFLKAYVKELESQIEKLKQQVETVE